MRVNRNVWTARSALALALVAAALAVYGAIDGELTRRGAAASAREARDYAGIAYLAASSDAPWWRPA